MTFLIPTLVHLFTHEDHHLYKKKKKARILKHIKIYVTIKMIKRQVYCEQRNKFIIIIIIPDLIKTSQHG